MARRKATPAAPSGGPLRFALFKRVSTEQQAEKGGSLAAQEAAMREEITRRGDEVVAVYGGQEHGMSGFEKKELFRLIGDIDSGKFNAIMCFDLARWSRDPNLETVVFDALRDANIRFFNLSKEHNLFDEDDEFVLAIMAAINRKAVKTTLRNSVAVKIHRAQKGCPTCGRIPIGRTFTKKSPRDDHGVWGLREDVAERIRAAARDYLTGEIGLEELGKRYGFPHATMRDALLKYAGDTWVQTFNDRRGQVVEVPTKIPALLDAETIAAIRDMAASRKTYGRKPLKREYLLGGMIYLPNGKALTGWANSRETRYYRPFGVPTPTFSIPADLLEAAVCAGLGQILSSDKNFMQSVLEGRDTSEEQRAALAEQLAAARQQLKKVDEQGERLAMKVAEGVVSDEHARAASQKLSDRAGSLADDIRKAEAALREIPRREAVERQRKAALARLDEKARAKMKLEADLQDQTNRSWVNSGAALMDKGLLAEIFGCQRPKGGGPKPYGIFVEQVRPGEWRFEARGRLGNFMGSLDPRDYEQPFEVEVRAHRKESATTKGKIADNIGYSVIASYVRADSRDGT